MKFLLLTLNIKTITEERGDFNEWISKCVWDWGGGFVFIAGLSRMKVILVEKLLYEFVVNNLSHSFMCINRCVFSNKT